MDRTIFALCQFFLREIPRLSVTYDWKIPQIDGFSWSGHSGYQANLDLKLHLKQRWDQSPAENKLEIATIIVRKWGGIRTNEPETLLRYLDAIARPDPPTPLSGVASYSKIFSIARPEQFAIYDARVAACLNAVQINAGVKDGVAMNYVPGRNNVVGNAAKKCGFTEDPRFATHQLVRSGWLRVARDATYGRYLELLSHCLKELPNSNLAELEMALFANAEHECKWAMTRETQ